MVWHWRWRWGVCIYLINYAIAWSSSLMHDIENGVARRMCSTLGQMMACTMHKFELVVDGDWVRRLDLVLILWRVKVCRMDHLKEETSWIPRYV